MTATKNQAVRGTTDLLPNEASLFRFIEHAGFELATLYGFKEIRTPIFEFSEVFHRTLGESSDVVSKETYSFVDRGGESLTLRPEGTAGIARAFIEHGMKQHLPLKFSYCGPMFRYERPQKGRQRQFHQFGVESLGFESPLADVEGISLGYEFLRQLHIPHKFQVEINSLGDTESRVRHRKLLVEYLHGFREQLSAESQIRLEKNPLRILDSKSEQDQKLVSAAPTPVGCLNDLSQDFYGQVLDGLKILGIPVVENPRLVRGLDYYSHTVFEITAEGLGAQATVLAGGRYDGLIELMGGDHTPGFGWGSGLERLAILLAGRKFERIEKYGVLCLDSSAEMSCLKLMGKIRHHGKSAELISGNQNLGKKIKRAEKLECQYVVLMGPEETASETVTCKNLLSGEQKKISENDFLNSL